MDLVDASPPTLEVLPLRDIVFHEEVDLARVAALIERLGADGILRNPPVVVPFGGGSGDGDGRRLLLDGANRVEALARMGIAHAAVQTESADDPGLRLFHWNHVIRKKDAEAVLREPPPGVRVRFPATGADASAGEDASAGADASADASADDDEGGGAPLCRLLLAAGGEVRFHAEPAGDEAAGGAARETARAAGLRAVVNRLAHPRGRIARVAHADLEEALRGHPDCGGLLVYPDLPFPEVRRMAASGERLPSGVTRFLPPRRVLGFDLPLSFLATDLPLSEKRRRFEAIVAERFESGRVRFYAEPTIVFDD